MVSDGCTMMREMLMVWIRLVRVEWYGMKGVREDYGECCFGLNLKKGSKMKR